MSKPITVSIVGNAGPLKKSLREADQSLSEFGASLKKFGLAAAAGVGTLAAGIGFAAKAAAEDQKSFVLMSTAIRNVTGATNDQIKALDAQIGKMSLATGIADDKLRPAFAALTRGTRDIEAATRDFDLVLDISTSLQMDATTVADALAKGYEGNMKALRGLSPEMAAVIKEGASMNEVLDILRGNFSGATADAADTFQGRMARLQVAFSEIVEQVGYALLPILERIATFIADKVVPVIQEFADAFSEKGLSGVIDVAMGKVSDFYDETSAMTRFVINASIALGGMYTAFRALTFIQTISKLMDTFTAATGRATLAVGGFQTTALGMVRGIGLVAASVAITLEGLLQNNAEYGRILLGRVGKFVNIFIGMIETAANSAVYAVNLINRAYNAIPFLPDVPLLGPAKIPRLPEDFSAASGATAVGGFGIPAHLGELGNLTPTLPGITPPTPTPPPPDGSGDGRGGRGGRGGGMMGDFSSGGIDSSYSGDIFSLEALAARAAVVNITVNTVSADANLPNLIVDALQQYNLVSGPIDVAIAS